MGNREWTEWTRIGGQAAGLGAWGPRRSDGVVDSWSGGAMGRMSVFVSFCQFLSAFSGFSWGLFGASRAGGSRQGRQGREENSTTATARQPQSRVERRGSRAGMVCGRWSRGGARRNRLAGSWTCGLAGQGESHFFSLFLTFSHYFGWFLPPIAAYGGLMVDGPGRQVGRCPDRSGSYSKRPYRNGSRRREAVKWWMEGA